MAKNVSSVESFPITSGDDYASYAKNSTYQQAGVRAAKEIIYEAIRDNLEVHINGDDAKQFQIADLGCSVGPNTFVAVQNIIQAITELRRSERRSPPSEFLVFFNDHVDNDFNALFRSVHPPPNYFAAGVPGSFHGRLFPKSTLLFAHSSYSIQWLSRVPEKVTDRNSPAWNGDRIYCAGEAEEAVADAYFRQFKEDMEGFLGARAEEVVRGGLVFLIVAGLPDDVDLCESALGIYFDLMDSCLRDLSQMGMVSKENVELFSLPMYNPSMKALKAVIEENGRFSIERMEMIANPLLDSIVPSPQMVTMGLRSVFETIFKKNFGHEIVEDLFGRFQKKLEENFSRVVDKKTPRLIDICVVLKNKMH